MERLICAIYEAIYTQTILKQHVFVKHLFLSQTYENRLDLNEYQ